MKSAGDGHDPVAVAVAVADADAEFLSGGDARALRCELDEHLLVGRHRSPEEVPATRLLTPPGPTCC
jgi:hypothetical protein